MRTEIRDNKWWVHYDSTWEFAQAFREDAQGCDSDEFCNRRFGGVRSPEEALRLAENGWDAEIRDLLTVAEEAIETVFTEHELPTFTVEHSVAGCEVDVARYLDGTPENMIDYPLAPIVRAGRVITLCASIAASAAVDEKSIKRRGQAVAALALALQHVGYSCEIYADHHSTREYHGMGDADKRKQAKDTGTVVRVKVKGASDTLDPGSVIFALAHPAASRVFGFAAHRKAPADYAVNRNNMGYPCDPLHDLPEGTIYLPCMTSATDIPDAKEQLLTWLKDIELVVD